MAKYYVMTADGKNVLCSINSAWSFEGAISSFMFSATCYCISKYNDVVVNSEFYPPNLVVAKKTSLRGKISGMKYTLFQAIGDTDGKDTIRYRNMGPVDNDQLVALKNALSNENIKKVEYIRPSELMERGNSSHV